VVAVGFTVCVPPAAGSVYELPSDPVIVTFLSFAAVTDSVAVPPAAMEAGLAEILTVGAGIVTLPLTLPHPTAMTKGAKAQNVRDTNR
jgi:hypothetical protein